MKRFELPPTPRAQTDPVKAWSEPVTIPTYLPAAPEPHPMFLEKRVYQGSSGKVYPLPCVDRIQTEAVDQQWQALHIENELVRVMVLPEIGGRVHIALDKTNGYDLFYRQDVIKPALVGLAGPWASGGVEFNWPQHHRPATFMPMDFDIENHADGSKTIWCSDHDPMNRLKGMHGVCLHPGRSFIELKVRLYNRTPFVQTFLWWANIAVSVHEQYQSFFPQDVHFVADHARRATSTFPRCQGTYYGVNYGRRAENGIPVEETPTKFIPPGTYPPDDLSWYANIPVPTSYMATGSREDFHGGYDHRAKAGLVLISNHHIAPGKKQWTWGNHDFGYAWDRQLSDDSVPYIELMSGVYTDNQPDFSFLAPFESKEFSHHWYPIREIGPAQQANVDAAIRITTDGDRARIGVHATGSFPKSCVRLESDGQKVAEWEIDLSPAHPVFFDASGVSAGAQLSVVVLSERGEELVRYRSYVSAPVAVPTPATEPGLPADIASSDELYLIGVHLEQYRHATRSAENYWQEAIRRDPRDSRCNHALGLLGMRGGEFQEAEAFFRACIAAITKFNANPPDGEPFYNLGLTLRYLDKDDAAYDAFYKSSWSQAWKTPAYTALAELDIKQGSWPSALQHLRLALITNADHLKARCLKVIVLRHLGRDDEATEVIHETRQLDPLDIWAKYLASGAIPRDNQQLIDLALDYGAAGLCLEAADLLQRGDLTAKDGTVPLLHYAAAFFYSRVENSEAAKRHLDLAAKASPLYCFPSRLEEMRILQWAIEQNGQDSRAPYYLGNLLYDRKRYSEAITLWERSVRQDPSFSIAWRNLGIGYFNVLHSPERALDAFNRAFQGDSRNARVLYERDQLWKRVGESPETRLQEFARYPELVAERDDLSVELATLFNQLGRYGDAVQLLQSRQFQPWEGGEGLVLAQHVRANLGLGRMALRAGNVSSATKSFQAALSYPENLGEARHPLANCSDIYYWLGEAAELAGKHEEAKAYWLRATQHKGDFQQMSVTAFSEMSYYSALSLKRLQRTEEAVTLLKSLLEFGTALAKQKAKIDYFATSLPTMLLFDDDLDRRLRVSALFLQSQAYLGLGEIPRARELAAEVMSLDRNHPYAGDLFSEYEFIAGTATR